MVSASRPSNTMAEALRGIQQHVDLVCLGAMETQRETPDSEAVGLVDRELKIVKDLAIAAGAREIVEAALLVEQAFALAHDGRSAPAPYLGHFVTSIAADLARVVHGQINGEQTGPVLAHARETLRTMPRRGSDYLVEIDLNDREQVARVFAAMGDNADLPESSDGDTDLAEVTPISPLLSPSATAPFSRMRELRELLGTYVTLAENIRSSPGRVDVLDDLLLSTKALRASAAGANLRVVERILARVGLLVEAHRATPSVLAPEVVDLIIAAGRIIAAVVDTPEADPRVINRANELIERASVLLRRFDIDTRQLGTGLLPSLGEGGEAAESGMAGTGAEGAIPPPRTLYQALRFLGRGQKAGDVPDSGQLLAESHSRTDTERYIGEIIEALGQFSLLINEMQHDHYSEPVRRRLLTTVVRLKESSAAAAATPVLERCWRLETLLKTSPTNQHLATILPELKVFRADLEWIIAQVRPEPEPVEVFDSPAHVVSIDVGALDHVANLLQELTLRSGGVDYRSRRLSLSVQDLSVVNDRLRALSRALQAGGDSSQVLAEIEEIISDIAVAATDLDQVRGEFDAVHARTAALSSRLSEDVQALRLVPIATITPALERAVRGLAQRLGKQVTFAVEGGSTLVNSALLDGLASSLLHIVRNAVDHGIEAPAVRQSGIKPAVGTVRLRAFQDDNQTVIEISDDGIGIDHQSVVRSAVARGYPVPDEGLSPESALQLIFLPWLSTRSRSVARASEGQGLDTVSTTIAEMRGTVSARTRPGFGTTITIRLPLALALTEVAVVSLGDDRFAIPFQKLDIVPASAVQSIVREGTNYLANIGTAHARVIDLGAVIGLRSPDQAMARDGVFIRFSYRDAQWLARVDSVLGSQDVAIDFADQAIPLLPGVVGSTSLISGERALVIDLAQAMDGRRTSRRRRSYPTASLGNVPFALVADVSVSVRRTVSQILELLGWRAIEARDGLEAWELVETVQPEILVIDLSIPVLDGFQVIRAAKSQRNVSVIVLTTDDDREIVQKAASFGVDAFLKKPLDEEQLLESLRLIGHMVAQNA